MPKKPDDLKKSTALAATPRFVMGVWPGQVPNRENIEALRLAQQEPPKFSIARLLQHDGSYLTPASVVDGIGMDDAKRSEWVAHLSKAVRGTNELTFRQDILGKMLYDRMDGATRQALFQRSMQFYRDMRKSLVEVQTPEDLRKSNVKPEPDPLVKAIYRRVRRAQGKLPLSALQDLVKSYGASTVAKTLDEACGDRGGLSYRDGVLIRRCNSTRYSDE